MDPFLTFEPNGLLTNTKSTEPTTSPVQSPPNETSIDPLNFIPSGLLSHCDAPVTANTVSDRATLIEVLDMDNLLFEPNGLLLSSSRLELGDHDATATSLRSISPNTRPLKESSKRNTVKTWTPSNILNDDASSRYSLTSIVKCRAFDGTPVSFSRKSKSRGLKPVASSSREDPEAALLDVPLHRLMDKLAMEVVQDAAPGTSNALSTSKLKQEDVMWVDKYRPQVFTDLVGDERVNREVMRWVKGWDQCVFGKKVKKLKRTRKDMENENENEGLPEDPWGRPKERILLVSGPPGLGKTTLAHVIATQAGYSVLEINASDARTGNAIEDRVKPALESGKAMGSSKPVLVVIDEIDGATGENSGSGSGFINKLVGLTIDPPLKRRDNGKSKNKGKRPLLRPIICICNDLYANSLAKLRPHAHIIRVNPSAPHLLSKRLSTVCASEGLKVDGRALVLLAEKCQGDMRSCLNALQFIKMRSSVVTESIIRIATVGVKETETSAQSVWADLFTPLSKQRVKNLGMSDEEESRYVARLVRAVESSGNIDKVVLGAFEHYLTLHQHDALLTRFATGNEWISAYDALSSTMRTEQDYALLGYMAYAIVPLYAHFAAVGNPKVERPTAYWDNYSKIKSSEEILTALTKAILLPEGGRQQQQQQDSTGYRHLLGPSILRTEFVPMLNRIISPPIRPVNSQIIKGDERALLKRLVSIMVSTGLRFQQEKSEEGQLIYRLEPAIDVFITYDGKRASDIAISRYAVRHVVSTEIESELSSRSLAVIEKEKEADPGARWGMQKGRAPGMAPVEGTKGAIVDKPAMDFFGRPIASKPKSKTQQAKPRPPPSLRGSTSTDVSSTAANEQSIAVSTAPYRVTYRYNEGNSNAVRKPTKVSSFLP